MTRTEHLAEGVTLYLGDCREVLPTLRNVDAVVTSPPYNCGMDYGSTKDDLSISEYIKFLDETVFSIQTQRICVNIGNYIGSREKRLRTIDVISKCNTPPLIDEIIWDKGPANGAAWGNYPNSPRIRAQHEWIYVYGEGVIRAPHSITWPEWSSLTTSIWRITASVSLSEHPAQMPIALADRLIRLYAPSDGLIVEPFMGSGTTGVAAVKLGRKFIGIEIEPTYFDIACRRISEALRQPDLFIAPSPSAKQESLI